MMMTGLIFVWLLPLTGSSAVTSGQHNNLTNVTAGEEIQNQFTTKQLTTNGISYLEQVSEISGLTITPPTTEDVSTPSLPTSQATSPTTTSISAETAGASISSARMDFTSSTDRSTFQDKTSITTIQTSPSSDQTSPSTKPSQRHSTGTPPASQPTGNKTTSLSTATPQPSTMLSTETTSFKPENVTSTSLHPVTGGATPHVTSSYKTKAGRPLIPTSEAKREQEYTPVNPGMVVAILIGGALFLMMVGFLLIYIKKQRLQKQQMTTTDWAGPSPFLEERTDNEEINLRSSNRIPLSGFLPQRLSKRLSLLPETDEELQDMTHSATFGGKHQGGTSAHSVGAENEQEKTEHDGGVPFIESKGEGAEAAANSASETSNSITDPSNSTLNNSVSQF